MGRSSDRQYSDVVRKELHNVLPAMRLEAARAAGELEVSEAVPELGRLLDDPDPEVAMVAIGALGQIGGESARQILQRAGESDDDEIVEAAEEALAEDEFLHGDIKLSNDLFDEIGLGGASHTDYDDAS
jgi:HEAT repeat protein